MYICFDKNEVERNIRIIECPEIFVSMIACFSQGLSSDMSVSRWEYIYAEETTYIYIYNIYIQKVDYNN